MKSSFVTEDSCTQHNCQQFEDPHNSLQQGLASVQQGLPNYVCVNGCMQSACAYHTWFFSLIWKNLLWGDLFNLRHYLQDLLWEGPQTQSAAAADKTFLSGRSAAAMVWLCYLRQGAVAIAFATFWSMMAFCSAVTSSANGSLGPTHSPLAFFISTCACNEMKGISWCLLSAFFCWSVQLHPCSSVAYSPGAELELGELFSLLSLYDEGVVDHWNHGRRQWIHELIFQIISNFLQLLL